MLRQMLNSRKPGCKPSEGPCACWRQWRGCRCGPQGGPSRPRCSGSLGYGVHDRRGFIMVGLHRRSKLGIWADHRVILQGTYGRSASKFVCMYILIYKYRYIYIYMYLSIHLSMCLCIYVSVYPPMYLPIYYLSIYLSINLSISICMYVCIYVCMHVYVYKDLFLIDMYICTVNRYVGAQRGTVSLTCKDPASAGPRSRAFESARKDRALTIRDDGWSQHTIWGLY